MDRLHFSIYLLQCVIKTFIQTWTHVFTSTKASTGHGVLLTGLSKRYIHFLTVYLHSHVIICIFTAPYLTLRLQSRLTPSTGYYGGPVFTSCFVMYTLLVLRINSVVTQEAEQGIY